MAVTWSRWALLGVLAFLVLVVLHAVLPWHWVGQMPVPNHPIRNVTFTCGPLWSSGYVHPPRHLPYPVQGTPCSGRTALAVMDVIDVGVGVAALSFLVVIVRRRPAAA